jgi:hypothetical protein
MYWCIVLLLFLIITTTLVQGENCDTRPPPVGTSYDLLVLALQWPPAYTLTQTN